MTVGFTGTLVLCRSAAPLDELEPINERDEGLDWHQIRSKSWQVGQYPLGYLVEDSPAMLIELAEVTGFPVLTGYVEDSDVVHVEGFSVVSGHWHVDLIPASKQPRGATEDRALWHALKWSEAAGLVPDADGLTSALAGRTESPLAEELFLELIDALGVPM